MPLLQKFKILFEVWRNIAWLVFRHWTIFCSSQLDWELGRHTTWAPASFFSLAQLKKHGTPQGPTGIQELQPFIISQPSQDVGTFRATQAQDVGPSVPTEVQIRQLEEADTATRSVASYSCPEQGCVKIYKEFKSLQKHLDVGRHLIKLERQSDYDNIIAKWAETCARWNWCCAVNDRIALSSGWQSFTVGGLGTEESKEVCPIFWTR